MPYLKADATRIKNKKEFFDEYKSLATQTSPMAIKGDMYIPLITDIHLECEQCNQVTSRKFKKVREFIGEDLRNWNTPSYCSYCSSKRANEKRNKKIRQGRLMVVDRSSIFDKWVKIMGEHHSKVRG